MFKQIYEAFGTTPTLRGYRLAVLAISLVGALAIWLIKDRIASMDHASVEASTSAADAIKMVNSLKDTVDTANKATEDHKQADLDFRKDITRRMDRLETKVDNSIEATNRLETTVGVMGARLDAVLANIHKQADARP